MSFIIFLQDISQVFKFNKHIIEIYFNNSYVHLSSATQKLYSVECNVSRASRKHGSSLDQNFEKLFLLLNYKLFMPYKES